MITVDQLRIRFTKVSATIAAKRELLAKQLADAESLIASASSKVELLDKVGHVLSKVAELSRRDTINRLEVLISYALQTILDEPSYRFFIQEREQKNGIIYEFMYEKFGLPPVPLGADTSGGGVGDIASTFLAIIIPIFLNQKARRFVVLDERFKHLHVSNLSRVAQVIKFLSQKLGIQFLIVTQREELLQAADKAYRFTNKTGSTVVKELPNIFEVSND